MMIRAKLIMFLQFLTITISILMISAHFYRMNKVYLAYFLLLTPLILIIKHRISARVIQVLLFLSTIEWWIIIYKIIKIRRDFNMPWIRFSVIMSFVAIFTLLSIFIFNTKTMKRIYQK
jgi:hypothetical protein